MRRLVLVCLTIGLVAAACGGDGNGDLEAYCTLVRDGVGSVVDEEGNIDPADFDALDEVAPPETKAAVSQLRNTATDLNEITELSQLFAAAFDPEAQEARTTFDTFAVESCGADASLLPAATPTVTDAELDDVESYIASNFANATWTTKVRYRIDRDDEGDLTTLVATFVVPAAEGDAIEVCQALGVWLYSIRDVDGVVDVIDDDLVVAQRANRDATCG